MSGLIKYDLQSEDGELKQFEPPPLIDIRATSIDKIGEVWLSDEKGDMGGGGLKF